MIIPLMNYLRVTTANRMIKIGLMLAMALTIISVIGSYSRGGFLALSVTAFVFWLRSSGKLMTMVLLLACFVPAVSLMPATLEGADQLDRELPEGRSGPGAVRRLELTPCGWRSDRPLLGEGWRRPKSAPSSTHVPGRPQRAAHSIYFQVLGDQGAIGLMIFLGIGVVGWLNTRSIIRLSKGKPEFEWAWHLGRMMQVRFISYLSPGAALSMAYYTVFFVSVAIVALVKAILVKAERAAVQPVERVRRGGFLRPARRLAIGFGIGIFRRTDGTAEFRSGLGMITVTEPIIWGDEYVPVNTGLLETVVRAFPGERVRFHARPGI